MSWNSGAPVVARTIEDMLDFIQRRLNDMDAENRGSGRTMWVDAELGPGVEVDGSGSPCWRKLNDGRIELRGRLLKAEGGVADGDVLLLLPSECAPPFNRSIVSAVTALAPCTVAGGGPGVLRVDMQAAWSTVPLLDDVGDPVVGADGEQVLGEEALVEVIARPPGSVPITGWVGLDHVTYDPYLYLDALPPVPFGDTPLVEEPGVAVVQQPDGTVVEVIPGVSQPPPDTYVP